MVKKHTNLGELVADIRNKIGSINTYILLLEDSKTVNEKIRIFFDENREKLESDIIESRKQVKDLLDQFENFEINSIEIE